MQSLRHGVAEVELAGVAVLTTGGATIGAEGAAAGGTSMW